jgi:hypothetical protein
MTVRPSPLRPVNLRNQSNRFNSSERECQRYTVAHRKAGGKMTRLKLPLTE